MFDYAQDTLVDTLKQFWETESIGITEVSDITKSHDGFRDLSEISRGEGGGETEGGSQLFETQKREGHEKWAIKRGRVMQIYARDHVEVHPQKKKEVLYLVKKKKKKKNNGTLWM